MSIFTETLKNSTPGEFAELSEQLTSDRIIYGESAGAYFELARITAWLQSQARASQKHCTEVAIDAVNLFEAARVFRHRVERGIDGKAALKRMYAIVKAYRGPWQVSLYVDGKALFTDNFCLIRWGC